MLPAPRAKPLPGPAAAEVAAEAERSADAGNCGQYRNYSTSSLGGPAGLSCMVRGCLRRKQPILRDAAGTAPQDEDFVSAGVTPRTLSIIPDQRAALQRLSGITDKDEWPRFGSLLNFILRKRTALSRRIGGRQQRKRPILRNAVGAVLQYEAYRGKRRECAGRGLVFPVT